jgi:NADP-dependent 3-hydroxy acid dehydrogenase YdfG
MLDTNVLGLANLTRLFLPALKASKGDIVNVGSMAVIAPSAGSALYAGTKAAITAFSDGLRKELTAFPVRVSIVHPGLTNTEVLINLTDPVKKERLEKAMKTIPPLQSEDLADTILFVVTRPPHVSLTEVFVRPSSQSF